MNMLTNLSPMKKAILAGVVGFILLGFLSTIAVASSAIGTRNGRVDRETALTATYKNSQITLDETIKNFYSGLGIADRQSDKVTQILTASVEGRYKPGSTAQPGGKGDALFSAIVEAYPNIDMSSYKDMLKIVTSGNAKFATQQRHMADQLREYRRWKNRGVMVPFWTSTLIKAPSDDLAAKKGDVTLHGQSALEQMDVVIQTGRTKAAFDTGNMEPLMVPAGEGATSAKDAAAPAQ